MAGYSGTPLAKKLGIKASHRVVLVDAPEGFEDTLAGLPEGVTVVRIAGLASVSPGSGPCDVAVAFFAEQAPLRRHLGALARLIEPNGGLWIAWPRKAAGMDSDITENVLREVILPTGLVDNKVCAVNETWSGLRFVWRLEKRPPR